MNDSNLKIPQAVPIPPPAPTGRAGGWEARATSPSTRAGDRSDAVAGIGRGAAVNLEDLARELERYVPKGIPNSRLQIEQDDASGLFIYRSVDRRSGEVLKQYPTEEMLKFISFYREREGLVVDDNV